MIFYFTVHFGFIISVKLKIFSKEIKITQFCKLILVTETVQPHLRPRFKKYKFCFFKFKDFFFDKKELTKYRANCTTDSDCFNLGTNINTWNGSCFWLKIKVHLFFFLIQDIFSMLISNLYLHFFFAGKN